MYAAARRIADSGPFEFGVTALIGLNAVALVFEWFPPLVAYDDAFWTFYAVSQVLFTLEIAVRFASYGPEFRAFFEDRWNVFDAVVVALSLLPLVGSLSFLARFARLARVLRALRGLRLLRVVSLFRPRETR